MYALAAPLDVHDKMDWLPRQIVDGLAIIDTKGSGTGVGVGVGVGTGVGVGVGTGVGVGVGTLH